MTEVHQFPDGFVLVRLDQLAAMMMRYLAAGVANRLLADYPPPGNAVLRVHKDPELDGWEAHARFLDHLGTVRVHG